MCTWLQALDSAPVLLQEGETCMLVDHVSGGAAILSGKILVMCPHKHVHPVNVTVATAMTCCGQVQGHETTKHPPPPLSTLEMQKKATGSLHMPGGRIMVLAEELYQAGFISYPRTETDGFAESMDLMVSPYMACIRRMHFLHMEVQRQVEEAAGVHQPACDGRRVCSVQLNLFIGPWKISSSNVACATLQPSLCTVIVLWRCLLQAMPHPALTLLQV